MFQLDLDEESNIKSRYRMGGIGQTGDPGICFIPIFDENDSTGAKANAVAMSVLSLTSILDRDEIGHPMLISEVDASACGGCGTCVKTCAFSASSIDTVKRISLIDITRCKGCGSCVVSCPTGARDLILFPRESALEAIDIMSKAINGGDNPSVLLIVCSGCGYTTLDAAGLIGKESDSDTYPPEVIPMFVECGGNIDTQYVLKAFSLNIDGVVLMTCNDGLCHHIVGNTDMERRMNLFRTVLRSRNIEPERLRILKFSCGSGELFIDEINDFYSDLKKSRACTGA
jgi:coenzyme F420-reducing hydrogenase delta subunit/Pyruvate/2-oxoacid:ferredoxin oxidoreductase delta subunit